MLDTAIWIIIAFLFILVAVRFIWNGKKRSTAKNIWKQVATDLRLDFNLPRTFSTMQVQGEFNDIPVRVYIDYRGSGGSGSGNTYTIYAATLGDSTPPTLRLFPQNFAMKALSAMGAQDVKVGDAAFDKAFTISCADPEAARLFLNDEVRDAILRLDDEFKQIRLAEGILTIRENGVDADPAKLKHALEVLTACARTMRS